MTLSAYVFFEKYLKKEVFVVSCKGWTYFESCLDQ